ncbi:MAG: UDP-glucuronic acid decarboxylase family protein [Candidatus Aenigmatarchaeota archaeon]
MIILVTGGAGFIGSHLCRELLRQGHYVICLDNFFTGSIDNIKDLRSNSNFELIRYDIIDPIHIECDQIYNLACPASPVHYQKDPIKTIKTSTYAMVNMLELALQTGARILQTSTSEVYGDPLEHPQKESYRGHVNCIGPRSSYDEGKRVAEALMMAYHNEKKVDIRIARLFNTYGPNLAMEDGRVVSNFIIQALRGQDITVYGKGDQTRSFCYISDMVDALIKLMNKDNFIGPVNLGNPKETTIAELAQIIIKLIGSSSKLVYKGLPVDDPCKRNPDISLARMELDWEPKVSLEDGLKQTIDYFRSVVKNYSGDD